MGGALMPAQITVQFPDAKLKRIERLFKDFPKELPRIMPRAINRTMITTRALAARMVKAETPKLKVGDIKKRMYQDKATRSRWRGKISMNPYALSLSRFAYKPTKAGVPFSIQDGRVIAKRAFRMGPNGAIMVRESAEFGWGGFDYKDGHDDGIENLVGRLPIHKLLGPSLSELYSDSAGTVARVTREAGATLNANIHREVNYRLTRRMPK
jgi:hypothetical protein